MKRHLIYRVLHFAGIAAIVFALTLMPGLTGIVGAQSVESIPATVGYIDHSYGAGIKAAPTADGAESKLWFNDGLWWAVLFNADTAQNEIYRLDWGAQDWVSTGLAVDSRKEIIGGVPTGEVAARADVLWDGTKLYVASHIKVANPSLTNNPDNWGKLFRYSYSSGSKTYTLDSGYPVDVNQDKTETLVLDKDSTGRLWVTYISRVPTSDPLDVEPYKVYVNYTSNANNDQVWATPIDLSTVSPDAVVDKIDLSSLIAFDSKVGVMWSNTITGKFYFADHSAASGPTSGWNVTAIDIPGVPLKANDHLKLVTNSAGQVFAALKTDTTVVGEPLVGVLARDTNGAFSFATFATYSTPGAVDTRPSLVLNESDNKLYLFVTSQEGGGVICYKSLAITNPLSNMSFSGNDCKSTVIGSADHFISDSTYVNIDNPTTSKHNVTTNTGIVVIASDDTNGMRYLHNVLGGPPPTVTANTPAQGETVTGATFVVTATFSQAMDPATITTSTFKVSGPGGAIPGTVSYDMATRKATFTPTGPLAASMAVQVQLTTGIEDSMGRALSAAKSWSFNFDLFIPPDPPTVVASTPAQGQAVTGAGFSVTATFSQDMDPASITPATFLVSGPGGAVPGTVSYDAGSRTATFTSTGALNQAMTVQVQLTTGITNAGGTALTAAKEWSFQFAPTPQQISFTIYLPKITR